MKKILMVLTSHRELENTDSTTGIWLGEFTDPYYEFVDAGYEVTLASPLGGEPPIDQMSELTENITASNRRFKDDEVAQQAFKNTKTLDMVDAGDYDALFYPGGHGPLWDLSNSHLSGTLILNFLSQQKPVGAVCHGPAALLKAADLKPGLLQGKRITGFTNAEEVLAMRSNNLNFKLEDRLKETGAEFHSAVVPFAPHVEEAGLIVTGQNPLSAEPVAQAVIKMLGGKQ